MYKKQSKKQEKKVFINNMWNYRIIKRKNSYGLYEVMYNDDGEIFAHSEEAEVIAESPEELIETLNMMLADANKSKENILIYDQIKFAKPCEDFDESETITIEQLDDILKDLE
jgi:hypothetical protein